MSVNGEHLGHGLGAALAALSLPEAWLSFGERIAMALIMAAVSTLASKAVSSLWKKAGFR